jgi:hypothetical protein
MARPPNKGSFQPGYEGGPGRPPKMEEQRVIERISRFQFQTLAHKYMGHSLEDLKAMRKDGTLSVLDHCVISMLVKAMTNGDFRAFEFLADRMWGKPVQRVETYSERVTTNIDDVNRLHEMAAKLISEYPDGQDKFNEPPKE